jgi:serine/threonine protein kinase
MGSSKGDGRLCARLVRLREFCFFSCSFAQTACKGAFGEIFQGRNVVTNEDVAIKVERIDSKKQVLKLEVAVLKKLQPCEYVVPFVTYGRHGEYNYLVMELLGENISELRRRQLSGRFSIVTTCLLALQMLTSIRAVHDMGYLHRDVGNQKMFFVVWLKKENNR